MFTPALRSWPFFVTVCFVTRPKYHTNLFPHFDWVLIARVRYINRDGSGRGKLLRVPSCRQKQNA